MLLNKRMFAVSVLTTLMTSNINAAGFALSENSASGMGSAFAGASAIAEDASTTYFNPAGLSKLDGNQMVVAGHYVTANAGFANNGSTLVTTGTLSGANDDPGVSAFIPNFYYANQLNDQWTFGLGIKAPFGQSTDYSDTWVGRYHATKSEITTLNINPSASFKVSDKFSVGFGVNVQYIEATLANQLDSRLVCMGALIPVVGAVAANTNCNAAGLTTIGDVTTDSSVSLNADDWSLGWNVGLLYDVNSETRLGLAYRSNIKHGLTGTADFTRSVGLNAILGASTAFADTGISAGVDLPETLSLSLYHDATSKWAVLADVTWTKWSRFDKLEVDFSNPLQATSTIPENWEDSLRYSLGMNYKADANWIYRAGLALDETPIATAEDRTARLPGDDRIWLSLGFGYKMSNTSSVDVGYAHIFFDDIPINNTDASFGHTLTGTYDVSADIFSAQFNWKF